MTLFGIVIAVSWLWEKAKSPMFITLFGIVTDVSLLAANAPSQITVTPVPIVKVVMLLFRNAIPPIFDTLSGITTEVTLLSANANVPISFTITPPISHGITISFGHSLLYQTVIVPVSLSNVKYSAGVGSIRSQEVVISPHVNTFNSLLITALLSSNVCSISSLIHHWGTGYTYICSTVIRFDSSYTPLAITPTTLLTTVINTIPINIQSLTPPLRSIPSPVMRSATIRELISRKNHPLVRTSFPIFSAAFLRE